jgi:hypothetical protein
VPAQSTSVLVDDRLRDGQDLELTARVPTTSRCASSRSAKGITQGRRAPPGDHQRRRTPVGRLGAATPRGRAGEEQETDQAGNWTRAKYAGKTGLSMSQMRRRFCDRGWRFAHNGVVFTGAASVSVKRYRFRGDTIPTPWIPISAAAATSG